MEPGTMFHQCPHCLTSWDGLAHFVSDPDLRIDGYLACFVDPEFGLVQFTHATQGCNGSLAVWACSLRALHGGPFWTDRRPGLDGCPRLCLDPKRLEECDAECGLAWVRSALQWLRRHEVPPHMGRQNTEAATGPDSRRVA